VILKALAFKVKMGEPEMLNDRSRVFQYIKIESEGRRYFCLQQNLAVLAWILFFKNDTLRPYYQPDSRKSSVRPFLGRLRHDYRSFRKNLNIFLNFIRYKFHLKKIESVMTLPFYGQLSAPIHKGHKIFNLHRGVVIKLFNSDVHSSIILREIERLQKTSQISFAPSIRRWNIAERWYEEEYICGFTDDTKTPPDSRVLLKKFSHELVQLMQCLILFQEPKIRNAVEYVHEVMKILDVTRLSRQETTEKEFTKIKKFLEAMVARLCDEEDISIFLVFAHGDFCPANLVNTKNGIKMVDWEGASYRSALFDFYSYFFYRPLTYRVPIGTVVSEIHEALPEFFSKLAKKNSKISESLIHKEKVYRWVYYIEQICGEVEREMTDPRPNMMYFILGYIDAFNRYEETIAVKLLS